ncbi:hypothetical protein F4677DRAFT_446495 [Hypoxylon crocopeplum]|nr:hypothetical protein F4677DRAFT_446495 [Hypoxylon crocopeplum]
MAGIPLKELERAEEGAYGEYDAATTSGESHPFIQPDGQPMPPPPAYASEAFTTGGTAVEAQAEEGDKKKALRGLAQKICSSLMIVVFAGVGFGTLMTLAVIFFRTLVWVWEKLGLLGSRRRAFALQRSGHHH